MKKITLSFLFTLVCLFGFSQENNLIGIWENTSNDHIDEKYEFKENQTAIMIKEGNNSPPFSYTYDSSKTPHWLNLSVASEDFQMTMLGLVEFIDENTLKLELFPENESSHPASFTENGTSDDIAYVILRRI